MAKRTFTSSSIKKAIKAAQDMGLVVSGFELLADGGFRLLTNSAQKNEADASLDQWMRSQRGAY